MKPNKKALSYAQYCLTGVIMNLIHHLEQSWAKEKPEFRKEAQTKIDALVSVYKFLGKHGGNGDGLGVL